MKRNERGFTYLGVMLAIAIMGILLAATGQIWHIVRQREKERELLFIGHQFRQAIAQYYARDPKAIQPYPQKLEDLLLDRRNITVLRHLRQIYVDPMSGQAEWGLVKTPVGGIIGVFSLSDDKPLKSANFGEEDGGFTGKTRYSEWKFIFSGAQDSSLGTPASIGGAGAPQPSELAKADPSSESQAASAPTPSRSLFDDLRERSSAACDRIRANDLRICGQVAARWDEQTGQACVATAAARYSKCLLNDGGALPPLYIRYF